MNYKFLENYCLKSEEYELVSIRNEDMLLIKEWRNDQIDVLRQRKPLSDEDQRNYFREKVLPTFDQAEPEQILLSYLKNGKCIGYGGLVHLDWEARRGEVSFLLETARVSDRDMHSREFKTYLALIKQLAFKILKLHRLSTETFDVRPWHVAVLESEGFKFEGRLRDHVKIQGEYTDSLLHGLII
ncbi:MAG: hypothetical protein A2007_00065 [Verrucomicrobia bacterium GWC2_42_7]|nr:MAG: hypothetical protein A2007_00065 [Verrucomicrobia bacterium GWC2_42_7]